MKQNESLFSLPTEKKKNKNAKRIAGIVVWSITYTLLGAASIFLAVYAIAYAALGRNLDTTTWVGEIREAFNEWRGEQYFVEIWGWVFAAFILVNALIVLLLVINDNRAKTIRKKEALKNIK